KAGCQDCGWLRVCDLDVGSCLQTGTATSTGGFKPVANFRVSLGRSKFLSQFYHGSIQPIPNQRHYLPGNELSGIGFALRRRQCSSSGRKVKSYRSGSRGVSAGSPTPDSFHKTRSTNRKERKECEEHRRRQTSTESRTLGAMHLASLGRLESPP